MAQQPTVNTPAVSPKTPPIRRDKPGLIEKQKSEQFIEILKKDHSYDIVAKIIERMQMIERAKKLKPPEKYRLLQAYDLALLSYCLPKIKVVEDNRDDTGGGVIFNIKIGGEDDQKKKVRKAGQGKTSINIAIPTKQNKDGTYTVDRPGS